MDRVEVATIPRCAIFSDHPHPLKSSHHDVVVVDEPGAERWVSRKM
jgi:hypothetical protein